MKKIRHKEEELEKFRENKLNGSLIRSRFQHNTMGEKPLKYFLNLENKNFISKHIRDLKVKGGKTIQNPDSILKEMKFFYSDLYQKKVTEDIENTTFHNMTI